MFEKNLEELRRNDLLRHILSRASPQQPVITLRGRRYVNFGSNDYLGLAGRHELGTAAAEALGSYGFGSGASRLLAGGSLLHDKLEKAVASFKKTGAALVFNSGYDANTGVIPALCTEEDVLFSDALNHASIIDGCRLSRAKTVVYRHKDVSHLKRLLTREKGRRKIIVTDTVFSMDGDMASLPEIYNLCLSIRSRPAAEDSLLLYLDDAHGTGVLGGGRGALAHFRLAPQPWIVQMGTFSKALGSFGAFVAGDRTVLQWIANTARSFIFSTALPSCVVAASLAALGIVRKEPRLIRRLWTLREMLLQGLQTLGYETGDSQTPIIPLRTSSVQDAIRLSSLLLGRGIYAPAIRPPAVQEPRLRITITAAHTEKQIAMLIRALAKGNKFLLRPGE